ncbi:hypothetical protein [Allomuricauda sp. SCSIO 65647]|uniref:hypothetical protein n=1 Tax=Allomuricauda sp. SCSIO 65647 TaxID=2908843 RepID=UPI001F42C18C|nr:hypothetical protein [Muricauda sp. SCSIO 65647]UJH67799.1 hypothetical protein L0P89_00935 [Muricauda sp. SCSIO 65647]
MRTLRAVMYSMVFTMTIASCNQEGSKTQPTEPINSGWKAIYKHDENGKRIEGNIDSLVMGIRNGYDVRIGWGWQRELGDSILRLEHVAKPLYISIIQDKNVSAIIDPHPLLQSYIDIDGQTFGEGGHIWQCIMTTKGTFNAQVYDRSDGQLIKNWPQNHKMTWFLEYPENTQKMMNKPLYK